MAKTSGHIRASKWKNDLYVENGKRKEYYELSNVKKLVIKKQSQIVAKKMYQKFNNKVISKSIGSNKNIEVCFTKKGCSHLTRDSMIVLSGKYFSKKSMLGIDKIFKKSEYVTTNNRLTKERVDNRIKFFRYRDK